MKRYFAKIRFFLQNWKLGIHFTLRTKRFGVNNQWWSEFDSMFGVNWLIILYDAIRIHPIIRNYKWMKLRTIMACTLHPSTMDTLGWKI